MRSRRKPKCLLALERSSNGLFAFGESVLMGALASYREGDGPRNPSTIAVGSHCAVGHPSKPIPDPQGGLAVGCFDGVRAARTGSVQKRSRRLRLDTVASHWPVWRTPSKHPLGLYGLHPRNTTGTRFTLRDRPGVSVSDRGKMGPSGESNAHPIESLPSGCASGCFDGRGHDLGAPRAVLRKRDKASLGEVPYLVSSRELALKPDGSLHVLQNAYGRGKMPTHHPCSIYGAVELTTGAMNDE